MRLADLSIRRPVFAVMLITALLVFGLLAYPRIGVDLFPNVEFPVVTVTAIYPGGDPETMESKVADPIEEAINTLSGIKALRSTNMESVSQVVVEFDLDVAAEQAVQDVRDRVSGVLSQLPEGTETPVIQKFDVGAAPIMALALAGELDPRELTDLADKVVKERVQRVAGVGGVELVGGREREIRVLVDPSKLAGLGLTVQDVSSAIQSQNLSLPAGSFERGTQEITVKTKGEVKTAEEVADILLPSAPGTSLRVRDVAQVIDGMEDARSASFLDQTSAVSLVIRKQSGANTVAVAKAVRKALEDVKPQIEQRGARLAIPTDNSTFIEHSIHDVQFDLVFGAALAVAIIMLFLRDFRATLISALAIPTSVVATFAVMEWLGFTFNNMTMLALSLSIGILIDDAIVVIENIHRRLETGESPMDAASNGTAQIFLAVLATTSSILAVFVPVAFMKGIIGRFFYQFGITVSVAVAVSMLVSFTLTPMLSSRFLRSSHGEMNVVSRGIEKMLSALDRGYGRVVGWSLDHRAITLVLATAAFVGSIFMVAEVQTEFVPPEDRAQFNVNVELPVGSSLAATTAVTQAIADDILNAAPGVKNTFTTIGGEQSQVNLAQIQVVMTPSKQRSFHQEELMAWVRARYAGVKEYNISALPIPAVGGQAFRSQPVQFYVRGSDMNELVQVTDTIKAELAKIKGFVGLDTTYRGGKPELSVEINREAAASLAVPVAQVASTVRALMAGDAVSEIKEGVNVYDITVQLPEAEQANLATMAGLQVRSMNGTLVDLANVVDIEASEGPSQIERQARQRQITVLSGLENLPLGDASAEVKKVAEKVVPPHLVTGFVGMADTMAESAGYMGIALFLAIILVYMILAAQFDSFIQPLNIMLSLPLSVVGAFGGLYLTGKTLNIFSMIGVIMLMGLVTKNAILLVDFANQLRSEGKPVREALVQAGIMRLRPILMTTAAMIFGMIPVAMAISEGGETRAPMAICVIGGLITSTLLTLIVVPVGYSLSEGFIGSGPMQWLGRKIFGTPHVATSTAALLLAAVLAQPAQAHAQQAPVAQPAPPATAPAQAAPVQAAPAQVEVPQPTTAPQQAQLAPVQPVDEPATSTVAPSEIEGIVVQSGGLTVDQAAQRALAVSSSVHEKLADLAAANARITQTTVQFVPKLSLRASAIALSPVSTGFGGGALVGAGSEGRLTTGPCPSGGGTCVLDAMGNPVGAASVSIEQLEHSYTLTAGLTIPLSDYLLRLSDAADGAEASREAARLALAAAERKVDTDTRVLYYNWLRAHAQVFLASKAVERTQARLNDARSAAEVGRLSNADVMRIEALLANGESAVAQAEALRRLIGAQLAIVMRDVKGSDYVVGSGVPEDTGFALQAAGDRAWVQEALANRLELKALDAATSALDHGQSAARAGGWPRLDAVGDVTYANPNPRFFPPQNEFNATWTLGLVASFSLDAPFGADAQGDELAANAAANRARRTGMEAAIVNEVVTAHLDGVKARAALRAAETAVRASEESYRVTTDRFQVGRATTSDLVEAESELLSAKLAITNARIDLAIAELKLDYALGRQPGAKAVASAPPER